MLWVVITYNTMLFFLALIGIHLTRRNLLIVLVCVEVILLSANLNFMFFGIMHNDATADVISLSILGVAAAESSVALAIVLVYYRFRHNVELSSINLLKG